MTVTHEALQACLVSSQLTRGTTPAEVGAAALAAAPSWHPTGTIDDLLVEGFASRFAIRLSGSGSDSPGQHRRSVCRERSGAGLTRWAILGADAAADLWDADGYRTVSMRLEKVERERGLSSLSGLPSAHSHTHACGLATLSMPKSLILRPRTSRSPSARTGRFGRH